MRLVGWLGFGCVIALASCGSAEDGAGPAFVPGGGVSAAASAPPVDSAAAAPASTPGPLRIFAKTHQDALLLPNQPANVVPADELTHYSIDQKVDDIEAKVSGTITIRFENVTGKPLSELPLVLHPNTSRELGVDAAESGEIDVVKVERVDDTGAHEVPHTQVRPTLVSVKLGSPVPAGDHVSVRVAFEGRLRRLTAAANDMFAQAMGSMGTMTSGAGAADYGLMAVGDGIMTLASAYPMVAPFRDGAFDTGPPARLGDLAYNDVAAFEVTTRVPRGLLVVTNLVDDTPVDQGDGWMKLASTGSHVRDFVLVGGRDLERAYVDVDDTRVTSVYRAGDQEAGKRVLDMAAASLTSFEKRFGPYPYRELDAVEASLVGGAGGVEFNSMVLIAGMLYRDPMQNNPMMAFLGKLGSFGGAPGSNPMTAMHEMLAMTLDFTVAHEVAHQYFAGIVGNDSHRFPSLDEPIAQYGAGLAMEDRYGKNAARKAMDGNVKINYAIYRMLGGADKPVLRDTASFGTPVEYAALVYGKAPYVYVVLRKQLGDARFHDAIRAAVDQYRFDMVTTDEWVAALEAGAGGPSSGVRPAFSRWLKETHGDADLGVDASGDFVLDVMLPPELARQMKQTSGGLLDPRTLMKSMMGGGL